MATGSIIAIILCVWIAINGILSHIQTKRDQSKKQLPGPVWDVYSNIDLEEIRRHTIAHRQVREGTISKRQPRLNASQQYVRLKTSDSTSPKWKKVTGTWVRV